MKAGSRVGSRVG
jgi:hypothetical protein